MMTSAVTAHRDRDPSCCGRSRRLSALCCRGLGGHARHGQGARPADLRRQRGHRRLLGRRRRRQVGWLRRRFLPRGRRRGLRRCREGRLRAALGEPSASRRSATGKIDILSRNSTWTMGRETGIRRDLRRRDLLRRSGLHAARARRAFRRRSNSAARRSASRPAPPAPPISPTISSPTT